MPCKAASKRKKRKNPLLQELPSCYSIVLLVPSLTVSCLLILLHDLNALISFCHVAKQRGAIASWRRRQCLAIIKNLGTKRRLSLMFKVDRVVGFEVWGCSRSGAFWSRV